jgi:NADPH:quinone reductase-like Zn-dependent oxidoreductase
VRALAVAGRDQPAAVQDVESTEPGRGEVRVAVEAASVNGIDAAVAAGHLWDMLPHEFPVVLGRDFAGTVASTGDGVDELRVGDRVAGVITDLSLGRRGAIAEEVAVPAATLAVIPAAVAAEQAAAVGLAGVTAHDLVDALALSRGDVVLVSGATGGVGAFAVQLAAAAGARVVATARPGAATDFVRTLGAEDCVDHTSDLAPQVSGIAPAGVTAAIHVAGDPAALAALLQPSGRLASALGATVDQAGRDDVSVTPVMGVATPQKLTSLLDAVASGVLAVPIMRTYPLDGAAQAITDFSTHKLGKLVVRVP